jgi:VanZ family protein
VLKKLSFLAALGYTIALATVCLIRLTNLPDTGISFADKIFHFLAYGLLMLLWYFTFLFTFNVKGRKSILYALIFSVTFGIVIEVLQDTMTDSRALDVYDILANTLGASLVSLLLLFKNNLQVKNS